MSEMSANGVSPRAASNASIATPANSLHRRQCVADGEFPLVHLQHEIRTRPVDVRRQHRDAHAPGLLPQRRQPIGVVHRGNFMHAATNATGWFAFIHAVW